MKRIIEIFFALILSLFFIIPIILISITIKLTTFESVLHWSKRVGKDNKIFLMPKFKTMINNTPNVATHMLENPNNYVTTFGKFLRKYSLDELPQLYSIFYGHMTFIGPRPALFNQTDLIELRTKFNIHLIKPGITGWAQVNGRDNLTIEEKVNYDHYYFKNKNMLFNNKILVMTLTKSLLKKNISH